MIKLKKILKENNTKPLIVYHGTGSKFRNFNFKNAAQPIIWFTSDKEEIKSGDVGASGKGYIITAEVTINNPAGWPEYERLGLGQLKNEGYDGAILSTENDQFNCFVFSPKQIKILKIEKV